MIIGAGRYVDRRVVMVAETKFMHQAQSVLFASL